MPKCGFYTEAGEECSFTSDDHQGMVNHIQGEHGPQETTEYIDNLHAHEEVN